MRAGAFLIDSFLALIFNAALLALPFTILNAWTTYRDGDVYEYALTPETAAATRTRLDHTIAAMIPAGAGRTDAWAAAIGREIDEGDMYAAHGLLLAAPFVLPSRLAGQTPPGASDAQIAATALGFLPADVRDRYVPPGEGGAFVALGDLNDLTRDARAWVNGEPTDAFTFILNGLGVALRGDEDAARAAEGAALVKIARRTGKLAPGFIEYLERRCFAAVPPQRLKQNLAEALAAAPPGGEDGAVAAAFQKSLDPAGYLRLLEDLRRMQAMMQPAGPALAAELLQYARMGEDLGKLYLAAQAGDRAWFVAKRAGADALRSAARGTLPFTPPLLALSGALALNAVVLIFAFAMTIAMALSRPAVIVVDEA